MWSNVSMKKLVIAIDFDGTIVTNKYPDIGYLKRDAKEVINKLYDEGHDIIINSCRQGKEEREMVEFLIDNEIKFNAVNENLCYRIEEYGNDCRKIGADIYIDDKAYPCNFINWNDIYYVITYMVNRKPLIICIVGESGSGKTTIAEYIEREHGIKMMESYTDRPLRYPGETGHTFVTKEEFDTFSHDDMIAYTEFGGYRYCCLKKDVMDYNTYVIDERGLNYLLDNFENEYDIVCIRVYSSLQNRIKRVGEERVKRDEGMFKLKWHDYRFNYIIHNDFGIDRLIQEIDTALDVLVKP
jgi:guanylate kinase